MMRSIDLQLFAEEKTEDPTPKRRREAREKGQVAKSQELASAMILIAAFVVFRFTGSDAYWGMQNLTREMLNRGLTHDWTVDSTYFLLRDVALTSFGFLTPLLVVLFLVGLIVNAAQVGFLFTLEPLAPKAERINPAEGLKRIFSKRSVVEVLKSFFRVFAVGAVVVTTIYLDQGIFARIVGQPVDQSLAEVGQLIFTILIRSAAVLIVLAIADYVYQRWEHEQQLKMSHQELKDERKDTEGDPLIRSRFREQQREMRERRSLQEVPEADVVITNPVHVAVALRYDEAMMEAPTMIAKGRGEVARAIRAIAGRHDVAVMRRPSLARTLYASVDVGELIPPELYQAVAEILAVVWRLKGRSGKRGGAD